MAVDLAFFPLWVPVSGFQWMETVPIHPSAVEAKPQRYLVPKSEIGIGVRQERLYQPLAETGLFRIFADTPITEESIAAFASRYGCLGGNVSEFVKIDSQMGKGEALGPWGKEIRAMGELVTLWEAARTDNITRLRDFIEWKGSKSVRYRGPGIPGINPPFNRSFTLIASEHDPEKLARFRPGDLRAPALSYVQAQVNKKLVKHSVSARLLWDEKRSRLSLHIVPESLIGCLWFQFSRAIDGNRGYRQCENCRKWFESSSQVGRADKVFCTPSCKASAHKKKIAEARRLHNAGVPVDSIADQLGTSEEKVEGWIKA